MLFDHVEIDAQDYPRMAKMYAAVLPKALNCEADVFDTDTIFIQREVAFFLIRKADRPANIHIAFRMEEHEGVKKAYDLAMAAGFTNNGAPGYRLDYAPNYYAAFVHDCDGNNVEFLCRKYSAPE